MSHEPATLVRYGSMGNVGQFAGILPGKPATEPQRGQLVVIRTARGEELGEVLLHLPNSSWEPERPRRSLEADAADPSASLADSWADRPRLIRAALAEDLEKSRQAERLRGERFELCRQIFGAACWPLELLDVELLLDLDTTVLQILGPWGVELALLQAEFRDRCNFHVVFELFAASTACLLCGATKPFPVLARGHCACCKDAEEETTERSSSAALATVGARDFTRCACCDLAECPASKRQGEAPDALRTLPQTTQRAHLKASSNVCGFGQLL